MLKGTVERLAFGGAGIVKQASGRIVFVPGTIVGEQITYTETQVKSRYALGRLESIVSPSPARVKPQCAYYGRCGGCQLQHMQYEEQVRWKRQWVFDALTRVGGVKSLSSADDVHMTPAAKPYEYRRRVTCQRISNGKKTEIGFADNDNAFLAVDTCPIFSTKPLSTFRAVEMKDDPERVVIVKDASPEWTMSNGLRLRYSDHAFVQAYDEQAEALYQTAISRVPLECTRLLDLYCGMGATSLLAAKARPKCHIDGIEVSPEAIALAKGNARANGLANRVSFLCGSVETNIFRITGSRVNDTPDTVLVNPPRTGCDASVLDAMGRCRSISNIIYISCMPSTLARDVRMLTEDHGFSVQYVHAIDMFPQTTHVETVVHLIRGDA
jgi:23S rRNA (uracil1939-C5)-methyltransferase